MTFSRIFERELIDYVSYVSLFVLELKSHQKKRKKKRKKEEKKRQEKTKEKGKEKIIISWKI